MHSLLEQYLSEVAEKLKALPVARRNEELREMRQHLHNSVIVNKEFRQSDDEAVQSAVDQFGTPEELGASIVWAWKRGEKNADKHSFWGAAACTLALTSIVPRLTQTLALAFSQHIAPGLFPVWAEILGFCLVLAGPMLVGGISALMFPNRAVAGTALAMLAHTLSGMIGIASVFLLYDQHPSMRMNGLDLHNEVRGEVFQWLLYVPTTILSALLVSRWRRRQTRLAVR